MDAGHSGAQSNTETSTMSSETTKKSPRGGRPKKADHERRVRPNYVRLTIAEQEHVEAKAAACGMHHIDYIRERALGPLPGPGSSSSDVSDEGAASQAQVASLLRELNSIGVNLNQLTRDHHTGRTGAHDWQQVQAELLRVLAAVGEQFQ